MRSSSCCQGPSCHLVSRSSSSLLARSTFLININHTVAFSLLYAVSVLASTYFLFTAAFPLILPKLASETASQPCVSQQTTLLINLDLMRHVVKFIYELTGTFVWRLYDRVLFKLDDHYRRFRQGLLRSREAIALQ